MKDRTITLRANDETMEQLIKVLQSVDSVELGCVFDFDLVKEVDKFGLARERAVERAFELVDADAGLDDDSIIDDAVRFEEKELSRTGKDAEALFIKIHPNRNVPIVEMVRKEVKRINEQKNNANEPN